MLLINRQGRIGICHRYLVAGVTDVADVADVAAIAGLVPTRHMRLNMDTPPVFIQNTPIVSIE
jgi:hypothetical protein